MLNNITINGIGLWAYGVSLTEDSLAGLFVCPQMKNIEITDWKDEDGIEVDLRNPKLKPRDITLSFAYRNPQGMATVIDMLKTEEQVTFGFPDVGISAVLRWTGVGSETSLDKAGILQMNFTEDLFELSGDGTPPAQLSNLAKVSQSGYSLDGVALGAFGCWVLQGSIVGRAVPKRNFTVESESENGRIYFKSKDYHQGARTIRLNLLFRSNDAAELVSCWNALFRTLTKPGARTLSMPKEGELTCRYVSSSVQRLRVSPRQTIWLELSVSLETVIKDEEETVGW